VNMHALVFAPRLHMKVATLLSPRRVVAVSGHWTRQFRGNAQIPGRDDNIVIAEFTGMVPACTAAMLLHFERPVRAAECYLCLLMYVHHALTVLQT
jgi:hypothetical protein